MKSPTNWALLALVIERPSYAYELARRFQRTYADALSLSSTSQIYAALDALTDRALVEELAGDSQARQPKPHYRATAEGLRQFEAWLVGQVREIQRLHRLLSIQLLALRDLPEAREILDRCGHLWREGGSPQAFANGEEGRSDCEVRLLQEARGLLAEANLSWLRSACGELEDRGRQRDSTPG